MMKLRFEPIIVSKEVSTTWAIKLKPVTEHVSLEGNNDRQMGSASIF